MAIGGYALTMMALIVLSALITIAFGADNITVVKAFSLDEARMVSMLQYNLQEDRVDPQGFYYYGNAHNLLMFYTAKGLGSLGFELNERLLIIVARLFSLIPFLLSALLIYLISLLFCQSRVVAVVIVYLFLIVPENMYMGTLIHPDHLQMMFFLASIYFLFAITNRWRYFISAGFAGLAAGTLYQPLAMIPALICYAVFSEWHLNRPTGRKVINSLAIVVGILLLATLAFFAVNSTMLDNWEDVTRGFKDISQNVKADGNIRDESGIGVWNRIVILQFGWAIYAATILGYIYIFAVVIARIGRSIKNRKYQPLDNYYLNLLYMMGLGLMYLIHHSLLVYFVRSRYLMLALPMFIIPGIIGLSLLVQRFIPGLSWGKRPESQVEGKKTEAEKKNKVPEISLCNSPVVLSALALLLVLASYHHLSSFQVLANGSHKYQSRIYLLAEKWEKLIKPGDRVYTDTGTFMFNEPAKGRIVDYWLKPGALEKNDINFVILQKGGTGRVCWKKPGTIFKDNDFVINRKFDPDLILTRYYQKLSDDNSFWRIVHEEENWLAFRKLDPWEIVAEGDDSFPLVKAKKDLEGAIEFLKNRSQLPAPSGEVIKLIFKGNQVARQGIIPGFVSVSTIHYAVTEDGKKYQISTRANNILMISGNYFPKEGNSASINYDVKKLGNRDVASLDLSGEMVLIPGERLTRDIFIAREFNNLIIPGPVARVGFWRDNSVAFDVPGNINGRLRSYQGRKGLLVSEGKREFSLKKVVKLNDFSASCWVNFPEWPKDEREQLEVLPFMQLMDDSSRFLTSLAYADGRNNDYRRQMIGAYQNHDPALRRLVAKKNCFSDKVWHFAVLTGKGEELKLYLDGIEVRSGSRSSSPEFEVTKLTCNSDKIPFIIGEMAIYDRALDQQAIESLYQRQGDYFKREQ